MKVIGLTGLIGSGKTTVANIFIRHGVKVIDTDQIAHDITASNGIAIPMIIKQFGARYIDNSGALSRDKMRELVFGDESAREELEKILHPIIFDEVNRQIAAFNVESYLILMVPLLFKSPRYLKITSRNIFVDCNYDAIVSRLKARNNFTQHQVDNILATQVTREKQMLLADDIIYNNGGIDNLEQQVNLLHEKYLQLK
ncbi:dephospho-CoA kinase [Aquella oligotrophica]|uniref:Dephospho-CoA kinase n=1 Tax=Aquella oligotrophica TaxID=2067065 RepID=A0A2I7N9H0_9NEIS|nr:dephospho-CoA kinase [Aquella oligotrophica]AUR53082.1 dephospho-CoA kinase [Aquella oligotrophica]